MTDTSDATSRPDDILPSERIQKLLDDYERAYAARTGPDHAIAILANYGEIALSFLPTLLAERTSEPSASARIAFWQALETYHVEGADAAIARIATAITSAETAARASVDPAVIRRAALEHVAEAATAYLDEMMDKGEITDSTEDELVVALAVLNELPPNHPPSVQPEGWRSDMEAAPRQLYRHKVRGARYEIVGKARIQCPPFAPMRDDEFALVYRDIDSGHYGVRREAEFYDGRFEEITPAEDKPT